MSLVWSRYEETQVLQEGVESAIAKINSVDEEVAELSSDVEQVQGEADGYDIDSRFEAVESELSEIASLQDNLKQVFQS